MTTMAPPVPQATAPRRTRPALRGVPRVSSLPFLLGVAALLGVALVALLMVNNTLAAGSFEQSQLKSERILLGEQEQALRQDVERLSSPTRVREAARAAGLVPAATTVYFDPVSGQILGVPVRAGAAEAGAAAADPLTDPTAVDPATGLPATAGTTPDAGTAPDAGTTPEPAGETADGATVGGTPPGTTAYDRAVVSGGGR